MPIKLFLTQRLRKVAMRNSITNIVNPLDLDRNKGNLVKGDFGKYCGRI